MRRITLLSVLLGTLLGFGAAPASSLETIVETQAVIDLECGDTCRMVEVFTWHWAQIVQIHVDHIGGDFTVDFAIVRVNWAGCPHGNQVDNDHSVWIAELWNWSEMGNHYTGKDKWTWAATTVGQVWSERRGPAVYGIGACDQRYCLDIP
jgi:hypothetical protein